MCGVVCRIGWVGDSLDCVQPHLFADTDFVGCVLTQRSTSGAHLTRRGPNTSFPIAGMSKRQGCVSHPTPEAELVSLDHALRVMGRPGLRIWDILAPKDACSSLPRR